MVDEDLLRHGINASGFPFELKTAAKLGGLGYQVRPSLYFLDRDRQRDAELDLLAVKQIPFSSASHPKISVTLRIAIECKNTTSAFVCFGLPHATSTNPDDVGLDVLTPHFRTSRDSGIAGRFNICLFHPSGNESPRLIEHHHYDGSGTRYHAIAQAETHPKSNRPYKVSSSEKLRHALAKLGAYVGQSSPNEPPDSVLEEIADGPYLNILFTAMVHPREHYRFELKGNILQSAGHTPIFQSRSFEGVSLYYVVDVISFEALAEATNTIEASVSALVKRVVPYMLATEPPIGL